MTGTNGSIKALRLLLRDPIIPFKDMDKHVREITGENDRLVAVVCASLVEVAMAKLLKSVMPNGEGSLFEPHAPLSTFSAKINLAYSLGLIDKDVRRNADYMREIRNVFAHRVAPTDFKTPQVAAVCKLLKLGQHENFKDSAVNMRSRYLYAAIRTGGEIVARSLQARDAPPVSLPEKHPPPPRGSRQDDRPS